MLEVVEGSTVGDGGDECSELERGERDALAEAAHAADAAFRGGDGLVGILAELLTFDVVAGQLAEAELVGVVADAVKAEFAAELLEVEVVALGQGLGHVHAEAGELDRGVAGDEALRERGQGDGELDGGAGLGAGRKGQLLVDHGQNAAVGGVDDDGGAVHVAEGVDGGLADDGVFAGGDVAGELVGGGEGTGGEALVITMAAGMKARPCARWLWPASWSGAVRPGLERYGARVTRDECVAWWRKCAPRQCGRLCDGLRCDGSQRDAAEWSWGDAACAGRPVPRRRARERLLQPKQNLWCKRKTASSGKLPLK